mgnify:CR=1 FL=1
MEFPGPGPVVHAPNVVTAAELTWTTDEAPGLGRQRRGKGFSYLDQDARPISDPAALERIRALAIPPAWTSVWISPDPCSHIQATGRDGRGRKQYIYHPEWRAIRDATKFHRMLAFGRALPRIRRRVQSDLARRALDHRRVVAGVVRLLDLAAVRVGNEQYAIENKSFGLTTLRCRHVSVLGESVRLSFNGKGGKKHSIEVCDRRVARVIRDCSELPGQVLFQYLDGGGRDRIRSQDVNAYLREAAAGEFTAKDFRTWTASVVAASLLACEPVPASKTAATRTENRIADLVAERLGNTRSICKQCYISPAVFDAFRQGTLQEAWRRNRARWRRTANPEERLLLWVLKQSDSAPRSDAEGGSP